MQEGRRAHTIDMAETERRWTSVVKYERALRQIHQIRPAAG
jgi:hypothetical protein